MFIYIYIYICFFLFPGATPGSQHRQANCSMTQSQKYECWDAPRRNIGTGLQISAPISTKHPRDYYDAEHSMQENGYRGNEQNEADEEEEEEEEEGGKERYI
ncbi:unnamed protein product [Prorocentrum cordatum]|uniref:Secreted protein n=1 Tax=Prorocentrum cordatum TaxID=2364126 RepID=A0ABN9QQG7_9DINO|nr:unnamed protein product [Polarella glacialis]